MDCVSPKPSRLRLAEGRLRRAEGRKIARLREALASLRRGEGGDGGNWTHVEEVSLNNSTGLAQFVRDIESKSGKTSISLILNFR